ncbi:MAG TPA: glutamyl-tRNA reductase [Acidimicrobiales bacterium]
MSVVVIGLNHRTVPLELLERTTVAADALPKALHDLMSRPNVDEAVLLSTCNRTEVYAVAERFHGAFQDIRDFLCDVAGMAPEQLQPHLYSQHDAAAAAHLFSVAAGLESAVLGESEILGQVRTAWATAQAEGAARSALNLLFRHALEVGKRARTETAIGRSTASVSYAAVEMVSERFGPLQDAKVLVVGAGEMGEGIVNALTGAGVGHVTVVNRTHERALELAARLAGRAVPFVELAAALADADVLLTSTGSGTVIVEADVVERAKAGRPLLVVDVAVPRDVDAAVADLPGVTLLDLDDLRDWAARGIAERAAEAARVRLIVAEEVVNYGEVVVTRQAAPLVAQLHEHAESVRAGELARYRRRLSELDESERDAVDALTRAIVAKLLHDPTVNLKRDVGTPRGERNAAAVRDLFDLA